MCIQLLGQNSRNGWKPWHTHVCTYTSIPIKYEFEYFHAKYTCTVRWYLSNPAASTAATEETRDTYTHAYVHPYILLMNSYIFIHNVCVWYIFLIQPGGQHSRRITPVKSTRMCIYIHKNHTYSYILYTYITCYWSNWGASTAETDEPRDAHTRVYIHPYISYLNLYIYPYIMYVYYIY